VAIVGTPQWQVIYWVGFFVGVESAATDPQLLMSTHGSSRAMAGCQKPALALINVLAVMRK
jgi:hypothetical protein